jgi:PleD family two-component response regulator
VLARIKAEPALRALPVVIFTSSAEESDMFRAYELGANAYLVKPMGYRDYEVALKQLGIFWIDFNELPLGMAGAVNFVENNPLQPAHVSH